jgi:hypothetical protein
MLALALIAHHKQSMLASQACRGFVAQADLDLLVDDFTMKVSHFPKSHGVPSSAESARIVLRGDKRIDALVKQLPTTEGA